MPKLISQNYLEIIFICNGYLYMKCFLTAFYGTSLNLCIISFPEHFSIEHTL